MNWLFGRRRKMDGRKRYKKKSETSLAVNKFQPKKVFFSERRDKSNGVKLREKSEMCVKKRFFFLWLLTASLAVCGSTGNQQK